MKTKLLLLMTAITVAGAALAANPLLSPYKTIHQTIPFDQIKTEHYVPAFEEAMKQHMNEINEIVDYSYMFCELRQKERRKNIKFRIYDKVIKEYTPVSTLPKLSVLKEKYGIDGTIIKAKEDRLKLYNTAKMKEFYR